MDIVSHETLEWQCHVFETLEAFLIGNSKSKVLWVHDFAGFLDRTPDARAHIQNADPQNDVRHPSQTLRQTHTQGTSYSRTLSVWFKPNFRTFYDAHKFFYIPTCARDLLQCGGSNVWAYWRVLTRQANHVLTNCRVKHWARWCLVFLRSVVEKMCNYMPRGLC